MVDAEVAKASAVVMLIITFLGGVITLDQIDGLYYCSLENTVQECTSLRSYGVADAKCMLQSGRSDICTAGGEKAAWVPASDYTGKVVPLRTVGVESIQNCVNETYMGLDVEYDLCSELGIQPPCLPSSLLRNGSCNWSKQADDLCINNSVEVEKVRPVCKPAGFIVTEIDGSKVGIRGSCCGYFEDERRIICKDTIKGICNPKCQQTSPDPDDYDEFCMIYDLTSGYVVAKMVGDTEYTRNNQRVLAEVTR